MDRPRLLDLFCGGGGAAVGYHRAGFDVTGVDNRLQKRYPFPFILADALEYVREYGREYDAIHASPPCQGYSRTRHLPWLKGKVHPMLIPQTREALRQTGKPWVIENVGDAPLDGIALRGSLFGLPFRRLRKFESNVLLMAPDGVREPVGVPGSMFGGRLRKQHEQLGIDSQAIPAEYTEWIGKQLMQVIAPTPRRLWRSDVNQAHVS